MTLVSGALAALWKLAPRLTADVSVDRGLRVPMPDGVELLADRWYPSRWEGRPPLILLRSPYGRQIGFIHGRLFAERGYQVLVQSTRGTFGSGGSFNAFRDEAVDGRATLDWIAGQPWFGGSIATFGPSYLGHTQWAIAEEAPPYLKAMALQITAADFRSSVIYPGESFGLENTATWMALLDRQERRGPLGMLTQQRHTTVAIQAAARVLPVGDADLAAVGHQVGFFRDWVAHDQPGGDAWWELVDHRQARATMQPAATLLGGWYDIFLPDQLDDYVALRAAGKQPRLLVGPWFHTSLSSFGIAIRDSVDFFDAHLRGDPSRLRELPVRLFLMGANRWYDLPDWPPPAQLQRWHLQARGRLSPADPAWSEPDRYRYDPADPTPSLGGAALNTATAGPKDNRRLEARSDVLVYTGPRLAEHLTVVGPLVTELYVRSSLEFTDFFVRLCDVSPRGRSTNLADGIVRLRPGVGERLPDGSLRLRIAMWPTAHRFLPGHRLRLQVSSGAHPLYARNTGTGEPLATATELRAADQEILHDPDHPSAIELPVALLPPVS